MDKQPVNLLLIEDTPSDAELVKRMLRDNKSVSSLQWVQTLSAAQDAMQSNQFDLILTDLGLPDSDGLETVIRLRELSDRLPIIALTGQDDEDLGLSSIRAGANDYILKSMVSKHVISRAIKYTIERCRMTLRLKEANSLLASKNERLAQMYKMSQQFVDNVSHEFRTPLTVIREFAAIIRDGIDGPVTSNQETRLSTLINRTDDLARMVDDLLDTSQLEAGLLKACRREYDLSEIVEKVERMLRPRAKAKKIKLRVNKIPADLTVFCDEEKLRRTLINLLVNAIKFTPVEGNIEVSTSMADEDRVRITVSDDGPGIAAEELQRIFERFQQVESHHRMASCRGFGLGLSIARALASLNLGSLDVASIEGEGSQFSVLVPIARIESVLNCYLEQRASTLEENGEISLVEIRPQHLDPVHGEEVIETLDEFLRSTVKSFDLVLQTEESRWLIYTCNCKSSLPGFISRITEGWSKLKRNHYGVELPDLVFDPKTTTNILESHEDLKQMARMPKPEPEAEPIPKPKEARRVLLIDDEVELASAIKSRLQAGGFDVTTAHDGLAGLEAASQAEYDAILLDIRLPKMDGLAVLSRLKSDPGTASTPVIIVSASLQEKQQVLDSGASFFIQKPFQSHAILAALDAAIRTNSSDACSQGHAGTTPLEPVAQR